MSEFLRSLYDIRVRPESPRRSADERQCEWPNCEAAGTYRAPKNPRQLNEHQWFCLDHVRAHNASWNFFQGMSMNEIAEFQNAQSTWHRPTWILGGNPHGRHGGPSMGKHADPRFIDPIGILDDGPLHARMEAERATRSKKPRRPDLSAMIRSSLAALDLDEAASLADIKLKFKQLVKRYHPDTNGGDNGAEDRLKRVIQAYRHLVTCGFFR